MIASLTCLDRGGVSMANSPTEGSDKSAKSRWQDAWQNYGLAVLLIGIVPILPILIELIIHKSITEDSLAITAAVYSITVAVASNSKFYFAFFLVASIIEAALYGSITDSPSRSTISVWNFADIHITSYAPSQNTDNGIFLVAMLLTFLSLLVERYSRHITNREEFFEFLKGKKEGQDGNS